MRSSPLFVATITVIAVLLLTMYGLAVLRPSAEDGANDTDDTNYLTPLDFPTIDFGNPSIGATDAKVTIVEYGDFLCTTCADMHITLLSLMEEFGEDIRYVWKDTPNESIHPNATAASIAARCAHEQGAFWEYHNELLTNQQSIGPTSFIPFAVKLNLNIDEFSVCVNEKRTGPLVERDIIEARRLQVDGTPYLFINKRRVSGLVSSEQLASFIRAEIAQQSN